MAEWPCHLRCLWPQYDVDYLILLFRPTLEESQIRFVMSGGHLEQSHHDRSVRFLVHEMSGRFGRSTTFSDEMVSNLELDNLDISLDKNDLSVSASGESIKCEAQNSIPFNSQINFPCFGLLLRHNTKLLGLVLNYWSH